MSTKSGKKTGITSHTPCSRAGSSHGFGSEHPFSLHTLLGDKKELTILGDKRELGDNRELTLLGDKMELTLLGVKRELTLLGDKRELTLLGDKRELTLLGDKRELTLLGDKHNRSKLIEEGTAVLTPELSGSSRYQTQAADLSVSGGGIGHQHSNGGGDGVDHHNQRHVPLAELYPLSGRTHFNLRAPEFNENLTSRDTVYHGDSPAPIYQQGGESPAPSALYQKGSPAPSVPPPPPLAHHQPFDDTFYNNANINQNEYMGQQDGGMVDYSSTLSHYNDYYTRYNFTEPIQDSENVGSRQEREFEYSISHVKQELPANQSYRYIEGSSSSFLVPPPLHPSPAVLLHIKYVMESVCDWMFFTDVIIVTSSDTLRAHRSVLSAHSSFLCYLLSDLSEGEDPVLYFPHHASLYVRMLLQFFYTGEVTRMTQGDIEPLRDICYCLGITSLIARLDDVKLTISFQSIPSYDAQIPHVQTQVKGLESTSTLYTESNRRMSLSSSPCLSPDPLVESMVAPPGQAYKFPDPLVESMVVPPGHSYKFSDTLRESMVAPPGQSFKYPDPLVESMVAPPGQSLNYPDPLVERIAVPPDQSYKFPDPLVDSMAAPPGQSSCKYQQQKEKSKSKQKGNESDFDSSPTRQYTVVSKMPRDTKLQVSKKCPTCKLKFFKKESYDNHLKLHNGETFKCDMCGKSISSKYHLNIHMQTHAKKKYACNFSGCTKEFSDPSALRRHHRNVHAEIKHVCPKCGTSFGDRSTWKRHVDGHETTTKFPCAQCKKSFKRKSQLKRHSANVHKVSEIEDDPELSLKSEDEEAENKAKCSTCDVCNAVFRKPYDLKIHRRVHTGERPYKCTMCTKSFSRSYNLQLHIRTHTGEKPHACARCGRCFSDVAAFRRHCRTHSGERPYPCNICGARFTQASTAYNHLGTCRKKRSSQSKMPAISQDKTAMEYRQTSLDSGSASFSRNCLKAGTNTLVRSSDSAIQLEACTNLDKPPALQSLHLQASRTKIELSVPSG